MRRFSPIFLMVLLLASALHAQEPGPTAVFIGGGVTRPGIPVPIPVSASYGYSSSAIDRDGNVFVFDTQYSYSYSPAPLPPSGEPVVFRPIIPSVKTRVTAVKADGRGKDSKEFDGPFQIVGVGAHAVYAIVNATSATSTGAFTAARRLVALTLTGMLPLAVLPSADVPPRADVKLSAAADTRSADTLSFVDAAPNPMILVPMGPAGTAPVVRRFVQIVKYSGTGVFELSNPVELP